MQTVATKKHSAFNSKSMTLGHLVWDNDGLKQMLAALLPYPHTSQQHDIVLKSVPVGAIFDEHLCIQNINIGWIVVHVLHTLEFNNYCSVLQAIANNKKNIFLSSLTIHQLSTKKIKC